MGTQANNQRRRHIRIPTLPSRMPSYRVPIDKKSGATRATRRHSPGKLLPPFIKRPS